MRVEGENKYPPLRTEIHHWEQDSNNASAASTPRAGQS
jgi:hypothetical protein